MAAEAASVEGMRALIARFRVTPETHVDRRVHEIVWEIVEDMRVQLRQDAVAEEEYDDPLSALQVIFTDLCCECAHRQRFAHPEMRDMVFKTFRKIQKLREDIHRNRQEARRRRRSRPRSEQMPRTPRFPAIQ